jgi:hypothetical protein
MAPRLPFSLAWLMAIFREAEESCMSFWGYRFSGCVRWGVWPSGDASADTLNMWKVAGVRRVWPEIDHNMWGVPGTLGHKVELRLGVTRTVVEGARSHWR